VGEEDTSGYQEKYSESRKFHDFFLDENDVVRKVRRAQQEQKKKKKRLNYAKPVFMWGIQYPEIPGKR
jgi:hypothetical protein